MSGAHTNDTFDSFSCIATHVLFYRLTQRLSLPTVRPPSSHPPPLFSLLSARGIVTNNMKPDFPWHDSFSHVAAEIITKTLRDCKHPMGGNMQAWERKRERKKKKKWPLRQRDTGTMAAMISLVFVD